jgi:hypothetical protein
MSSQATVRAVAAILRKREWCNREGGRSTYREHRSGKQFERVHEWGGGRKDAIQGSHVHGRLVRQSW